MKLFLDKQLNTSDKETAILAMLNGMYSKKYNHISTSVSLIGYEMTGRFLKTSNKRERTIIDGIKNAIRSLIDKGIIEVLNQNNDNYIFSGKGLEVNSNKKKFVVVEQWEMQRVFEMANKPFNVFSFFCSLIGTINNQTKQWHMSQDEMVSLYGYGKETVNDYLEQLEKMQLIYVYRHKKRRANGTYYKLNNSYGRYCDKDAVIAEALKYSDSVECEDFVEKLDRRAVKLRYNAYCNAAKKYRNNFDVEVDLYRQCIAYNKSLKYKPVEGCYDGEYKQGELLDLSVFPKEVRNAADDNQGEPVSMEHDFSIEEILDMPTDCEVQMNLPLENADCEVQINMANTDSVGKDELCKVVSPKNSETPKQDIEVYKTGDYKEPDHIEADSESHDEKNHGIFCVIENDSDCIDIEDLY